MILDFLYMDIFEYISYFFEQFEILYNLILVNKLFYNSIKNRFQKLKIEFIKSIYYKYPIFIIKLFTNISKIRNIAYLDFIDNFYSPTGEMDQIKEFQLNKPVMFSYDNDLNLFLILKLKIKIDSQIITSCISIFQKPSINFRWCINSHDCYYGIFFNRLIEESDILKLQMLLDGQVVKQNNSLLWIE